MANICKFSLPYSHSGAMNGFLVVTTLEVS